VPGVLLGKEKEKLLNGNSYRLGAECIWIPVANYLKPKELYLCGVWGRYVSSRFEGPLFLEKRVVTTGMIMGFGEYLRGQAGLACSY
jgi:hypothetical protein